MGYVYNFYLCVYMQYVCNMRTHINGYMCIYVYLCVYVSMCLCVSARVHMYVCTKYV